MPDFGDRGNQRLGELTDDLLRERRDSQEKRVTESPRMPPAPDVRESNYPGVSGMDAGEANKYTVQSVYDIRPINARDFLNRVRLSKLTEEFPISAYGLLNVPKGYTAVLREFRLNFTDLTGAVLYKTGTVGVNVILGTARSPGLYFLDTSNNVVNDPNATISQSVDLVFERTKTHIVIPENNSLLFGYSNLLAPFAIAVAEFEFYGNLLPARGRPSNFEVASEWK